MKIDEKVDKIKSDIQDQHLKDSAHPQQLLQLELEQKKDVEQLDLDLLLHLLLQSASVAAVCQQDQVKYEGMNKLPEWDHKVIAKIARMLKKHMEAGEQAKELKGQMGTEEEGNREVARQQIAPICLPEGQHKQILQEVFPKAGSSKPLQAQQRDRPAVKQATKTTTLTTVGKEQENLRDLPVPEGKFDKSHVTCELGVLGLNSKAVFKTMVDQKMAKIKQKLKERFKSYVLATEIKHHLKRSSKHLRFESPLIILKVDETMDGSTWAETRNALSLLACGTDANDPHYHKEYPVG